jgi:Arc/MetJ-type ribon-helix-helix transcriptional regulator
MVNDLREVAVPFGVVATTGPLVAPGGTVALTYPLKKIAKVACGYPVEGDPGRRPDCVVRTVERDERRRKMATNPRSRSRAAGAALKLDSDGRLTCCHPEIGTIGTRGHAVMTIEIRELELERMVQEEIRSGHFQSMDELLVAAVHALREKHAAIASRPPRKNLAQFLLESPFAGSDLDLERRQDFGRPVDL